MIRTTLTALALCLTQPAGAQPAQRAVSSAQPEQFAGRYEYSDRELTGFIELRRDGSFDYQVKAVGPQVEGEGQFWYALTGVWQANDFGDIRLSNTPTAPPRLAQLIATRDPSVRAAFDIAAPGIFSNYGLGLSINDGEDRVLHMLTYGEWTLPLVEAWDKTRTGTKLPRKLEIIRSGDDLVLATLDLAPGGPNRFSFAYTPSPIEPFQLDARIDGATGIEVEFGQASIKMSRKP